MRGKRLLVVLGATAAIAGGTAGSALAEPEGGLAEDPFVCPVIPLPEAAVDATGDKFGDIGDGYTFGPGEAGTKGTLGPVPNTATNADGDGSPAVGDHSAPGDTDYTAIWSGN